MKPEDFQFVPADADLVMAYSVDGVGVLDSMIEMIDSIEPGARDEIEEDLKEFSPHPRPTPVPPDGMIPIHHIRAGRANAL